LWVFKFTNDEKSAQRNKTWLRIGKPEIWNDQKRSGINAWETFIYRQIFTFGF
jgi:hypothetical protein